MSEMLRKPFVVATCMLLIPIGLGHFLPVNKAPASLSKPTVEDRFLFTAADLMDRLHDKPRVPSITNEPIAQSAPQLPEIDLIGILRSEDEQQVLLQYQGRTHAYAIGEAHNSITLVSISKDTIEVKINDTLLTLSKSSLGRN